MPTPDDSKWGSGESLGWLGPLEIVDDGDHDAHIVIKLPDGERSRRIRYIREQLGDEAFMELLADDPRTRPVEDEDEPAPTRTTAFKCRGCLTTWPGKSNDGHDRCPNCTETEGDDA